MGTPDFEAMTAAEDFERYFASTSDHTEFIHWMQRSGRSSPPDEIRLNVAQDESGSQDSRTSHLPRPIDGGCC
jgi:hypothetical protein